MRRNFLFNILISTCLFCSATASQAEMLPILKKQAGTPPFEVAKKIALANRDFVVETNTPSSAKPPLFAWLTDADPRITPQMVAKQDSVYIVRDMGNQLSPALASLDYAIRELHISFLLITGSTDSPAIKLFIEADKSLSPTIAEEISGLATAISKKLPADSLASRLRRYAEQNVDYQVKSAVKRYSTRIKSGRLLIAGSVIDLGDDYGRGRGANVIININGETDAAKIRALPVITKLDPVLRRTAIGRTPLDK